MALTRKPICEAGSLMSGGDRPRASPWGSRGTPLRPRLAPLSRQCIPEARPSWATWPHQGGGTTGKTEEQPHAKHIPHAPEVPPCCTHHQLSALDADREVAAVLTGAAVRRQHAIRDAAEQGRREVPV